MAHIATDSSKAARRVVPALVCAGALLQATCVGHIGDETDPAGSLDGPAAEISSSALRRLSVHELESTLKSVVGMVPEAIERVPPDGLGHSFDRVVNAQTMSPAHLEAFSAIATEVATSLMVDGRLDERVSGCPDASVPTLVKAETKTIDGNALGLAPDWSVGTSSNPKYGTTIYAPDPQALYSHSFAAPGSYQLTVHLDIEGSVDTLDVLLDGQVLSTHSGLGEAQTITATASVDQAGSHVIELSLQTEPDDNSLEVVFQSLIIEGPLASGPEPADAAVRDCALSVIGELAPAAYRRPLAEIERQRLTSLYDSLAETYGSADALHALLQAIFSSPHFLFLVEIGEPVAEGIHRLGPWELASRLSYAICEQPPDAALWQAAAEGELSTPAQIEAQARRLLGEPCAQATIERFFEYWLWLNRLASLNKSADVFPEYSDAVQAGMIAESKRFIAELVWKAGAGIESLFDAGYAWPEPSTAFLYGMASADGGQMTLPAERAGILTSPAVLAVTGTFDGTSPVARGVYVLEQILCSGTPPPPASAAIVPPLPDPDLTTRDRWAAHSDDPACASCHQLIDPIGFTFEEFDGIGRHRSEENGHPVDASGGIPSMGIEDGSLVGGAQLAKAVAASAELRSCVATQWLRFAFGRLETPSDADTIEALAGAFDGGTMLEAMLSIVTSEAFRHRKEGEE